MNSGLDIKEALRVITTALREDYRLLIHYHLAGYTHGEISELCDVSLSDVHRDLPRARSAFYIAIQKKIAGRENPVVRGETVS
jgi:DNA-directed RNA polymerase specialized sigma24 family protein